MVVRGWEVAVCNLIRLTLFMVYYGLVSFGERQVVDEGWA